MPARVGGIRSHQYYGVLFKAGQDVTQGSLLSAKLFNLLVNAVAREWLVRLPQEAAKDHKEEYLAKLMRGFFTIFNVDDAYFAS